MKTLPDELKRCGRCKQYKPFSAFHRSCQTKDGRYGHCKQCRLAAVRSRYVSDSQRPSHLKQRYGITVAEFDKLLSSQNNTCAICDADTPGGRGRFHVDHDHKTGKVRGLLCNRCNIGVGYFKDSAVLLRSAAEYLDRNEDIA